jgi:hypothetical protein
MRSHARVVFAFLAAGGLIPAVRGDEGIGDLIGRLPGSANTVAFVNVKAVRERGAAKDAAVIAGTIFPPSVDFVAYAAQLEPGVATTRGTYGLVRYNRAVTLKDIAEQTGGEIINVGDMLVVDTGRRGRVFHLAPDLIGFARQMNHQELYRWKQFAEVSHKAALHPYLAEALAAAGDAPIVGAVDLEHMLELGATCKRVSEAKAAEGLSKGRVEGCSTLLVGLKGVCLTVRGPDLDQAQVRLDFSGEVGTEGDLVKGMFVEALDDLGASIEDFRRAKVTVTGRTVTLSTRLSADGLIRIMSLFAPPPPASSPRTSTRIEANGVSIDATVRYWKAADGLLNELKRQTKNSSNYLKSATWHETYADRIEDLNTRYVDADVVKYAQSLLGRLRTLAWSLRGVAVEVRALEMGTVDMIHAMVGGPAGSLAQGTVPTWLGGGVGLQVNTNIPQIREKQAEIIRKDAERRLKIWESIDEDRRAVIKTQRERYGIDLGK